MSSHHHEHDAQLPPGTTHLISERAATGDETLQLFPTPSSDPNEPLNWSKRRKFVNYSLVLIVTLVIFTALSTQIIFWSLLIQDLHVDFQQLNNAQSINSAGLTIGCIFFIPFAIKYGRRPIYIVSTAIMFIMSIWSARMTTVWELYVTNLFLGFAGATNEAIVGLTVADLFFVHQRGTMNGFYLMMVMTGSFLTPLLAGVQATASGWRWSYYILSIFMGIILFLFIFFYEETKYIPTMESHEVRQNQFTTDGDVDTSDAKNPTVIESSTPAGLPRTERLDSNIPLKPWRQRLPLITPTNESLWTLTYRPLIVLFNFPAVAFAAIQYGAGLSWLVNMSVAVSLTFTYPPYLFKPAAIGYMGLGPFIGNLIGAVYCGYLADRAVVWFAKRNRGWYEPEMRLYLLHLPSLSMSAGLIMFGIVTARVWQFLVRFDMKLTSSQYMHWIFACIAGGLFGFGLGAFGDTVLTYVIDSNRFVSRAISMIFHS